MGIKIRKELNNIIMIRKSIIKALESQKAQLETVYDKYETELKSEMDIPSNKFLDWTRVANPFMDSVISSKLIDYELIQNYDKFVNEIVSYERDYLITQEIVDELEENFDMTVETVVKLEKRVIEIKKNIKKLLERVMIDKIKKYQELPEELKTKEGCCELCGIELNEELNDNEDICFACQQIDEKKRPFKKKIIEENLDEIEREKRNNGDNFQYRKKIDRYILPEDPDGFGKEGWVYEDGFVEGDQINKKEDEDIPNEKTNLLSNLVTKEKNKEEPIKKNKQDEKIQKEFQKLMQGHDEKFKDNYKQYEDIEPDKNIDTKGI